MFHKSTNYVRSTLYLLVLSIIFLARPALSVEASTADLQQLEYAAIELDRDLSLVREQIENPLYIYFSMDVDSAFRLDSLSFQIDDEPAVEKTWNDNQLKALTKGAADRLDRHLLTPGKHRLTAWYTSRRGDQRGIKFDFDKSDASQTLEIRLLDDSEVTSKYQPRMEVKTW